MSEIYESPEITIASGTVSFNPKPIQGSCEFCFAYTYKGANFMSKVVCEHCREKLLKRIHLIMTLE